MLPITNHRLLDLPEEVLCTISSFCHRSDAKALALTCARLQRIAEITIWRSVRFTDKTEQLVVHSHNQDNSHEVHTYIAAPSPQYSAPISHATRAVATTSALQRLLDIIQSSPWRQSMIKHLVLDFRHATPPVLLDLLSSLGSTLESLDLKTPFPHFQLSTLSATFDLSRAVPELTALRHLRLDVRYRWNETVVQISKVAPRLQSFHIHSHPKRVSGGPPAIGSRCVPAPMPHLQEVVVDEMEECFSRTLAPLLAGASELRRVAVRDYAHRWQPGPESALLDVLAFQKEVKELECPVALLPVMCQPGAFPGLQSLSMGWGTDLVLSSRRPAIIIPPLPALQCYRIDISLWTSHADYDINGTTALLPSVSCRIFENIMPQIHAAPSLISIHLPLQAEGLSARDGVERPMKPDSPEFSGMAIRSFVCHSGRSERTLTHCRLRLLRADLPGEEQGGWEEITRCGPEDTPVPVQVLGAVYAALGWKWDDVPLEREMVLPELGWRVLEKWQLQL